MNVMWKISTEMIAAWGLFLLGSMFYITVVIGIGWLINCPVYWFVVPVSVILSALTVRLFFPKEATLFATLYGILFIAVTAWGNSLVYDTTFDSIGYHYEISIMMANGWNPVSQPPFNGSLWAQHYAKALEMAYAAFLSLTGNLQSVKCVNFIFSTASLAIMWYALVKAFPTISVRWKRILILVAAANPVLISQLYSGYNDYCLWVETILLSSAFALLWANDKCRYAYAVIFMTLVLGINTKFTHFFYCGLESLFFTVWCFYDRRFTVFKNGLITGFAALIVGIMVVGYNPYVINTLDYPSPFYPLIGNKDIDIMTGNTPTMFIEGNRIVNFFKSLLSVEDSPWALLNGKVTLHGFMNCYAVNMRVNAFGILMFPILLLGLVLMLKNKPSRRWWALYFFSIALCLSFEQSWWARYIPFLWFAVVMPIIVSLCSENGRSRANKLIRVTIVGLCCLNATISAGAVIGSRWAYTHYINYVFTTQQETQKPIHAVGLNYTMRQQFKERGIDFIEHDNIEEISNRKALFRMFNSDFFDAYMELPESDYPVLYKTPDNFLDRLARYDQRRLQNQ